MATKSSRKVGGVLREVLVVVSVRDGAGGVGDGEVLGAALAVDVVASTAVDGPVGGLVNEGSSPGVGTSGGGRPEDGCATRRYQQRKYKIIDRVTHGRAR